MRSLVILLGLVYFLTSHSYAISVYKPTLNRASAFNSTISCNETTAEEKKIKKVKLRSNHKSKFNFQGTEKQKVFDGFGIAGLLVGLISLITYLVAIGLSVTSTSGSSTPGIVAIILSFLLACLSVVLTGLSTMRFKKYKDQYKGRGFMIANWIGYFLMIFTLIVSLLKV